MSHHKRRRKSISPVALTEVQSHLSESSLNAELSEPSKHSEPSSAQLDLGLASEQLQADTEKHLLGRDPEMRFAAGSEATSELISESGEVQIVVAKKSLLGVEVDIASQGIGARMRAAREARGLSREEVAHRIRIPAHVVAQLEAEAFDKLGAPIFVRGFLNSYAKELGMPPIVVQAALQKLQAPMPEVKAAQQMSTSQHLWQRYRHRAAWVLLTMVLVGPLAVTWFNINKIGQNKPQSLQALDLPVSGSNASVPMAESNTKAEGIVTSAPPQEAIGLAQGSSEADVETSGETAPELQQPLMAGLMPNQTESQNKQIEIILSADSWLDIQDKQGTRLEYGVAKAGSRFQYPLDSLINLSIGNMAGVKVSINGRPIDLTTYSQTNVVHLKADELRLAAQ